MANSIDDKISGMMDNDMRKLAAPVAALAKAAFNINEAAGMEQNPISPDELSPKELINWITSFNRTIRPAYQTDNPVVQGIYMRHQVEIMLGLLIARQQIKGGDFTGTEGKKGIVAIYGPHAAFFGLGDDYRGAYISTGGSMQNWIHSGSTQLSGTAGNDILFGQNVVHVLLGYAVISSDTPQTLHMQERLNTAPQPVLTMQEQLKNSNNLFQFKIRELESARILKNATPFRVQVLANSTVPASEWAQPIVVTYTTSNILQENDLGSKTAAQLNNLGILNTT